MEQPMGLDADQRRRYLATLQTTLLVHAQIKRLRGDESGAQRHEARARALTKAP